MRGGRRAGRRCPWPRAMFVRPPSPQCGKNAGGGGGRGGSAATDRCRLPRLPAAPVQGNAPGGPERGAFAARRDLAREDEIAAPQCRPAPDLARADPPAAGPEFGIPERRTSPPTPPPLEGPAETERALAICWEDPPARAYQADGVGAANGAVGGQEAPPGPRIAAHSCTSMPPPSQFGGHHSLMHHLSAFVECVATETFPGGRCAPR